MIAQEDKRTVSEKTLQQCVKRLLNLAEYVNKETAEINALCKSEIIVKNSGHPPFEFLLLIDEQYLL